MNRTRKPLAIVLSLLVVFAAGCSSGKSPSQWLGLGKSSAKVEGTYFSGVDGLTVRDAPDGSAKVVGELALYQKVIRSKVTGGYALVSVAGGNLSGWVVNSKLLWKLPSASTPAAEAPAPSAESQTPSPAATGQQTPTRKSGSGASVFDPY